MRAQAKTQWIQTQIDLIRSRSRQVERADSDPRSREQEDESRIRGIFRNYEVAK